MRQVGLEDAKRDLSDLLHAVFQGEDVVIKHNDNLSVRLVPLAHPDKRPQFGSAKGLIEMSDDFDAPLNDFKDYME